MSQQLLLLEDRLDRLRSSYREAEKILSNPLVKVVNDPERINHYVREWDPEAGNISHVIAHRSILVEQKLLTILIEKCKESNIPLVLFSGGISHTIYTANEAPSLVLNSSELYSKGLEYFLNRFENHDMDIRMISHGRYWNIAMKLSERHSKSYGKTKEGGNSELDIELNNTIENI